MQGTVKIIGAENLAKFVAALVEAGTVKFEAEHIGENEWVVRFNGGY